MSKKDLKKAVRRAKKGILFVRMVLALGLAAVFLWLPQVIPYEDSFFLSIAMLMLLLAGVAFLAMGLLWLWCLVAGEKMTARVLAEIQKPMTITLEKVPPQEEQ